MGEAIRSYPEWVALLVALMGLAYSQWQNRALAKDLRDCNEERFKFLEGRLDRHDKRINELNDDLLRKTDIKE